MASGAEKPPGKRERNFEAHRTPRQLTIGPPGRATIHTHRPGEGLLDKGAFPNVGGCALEHIFLGGPLIAYDFARMGRKSKIRPRCAPRRCLIGLARQGIRHTRHSGGRLLGEGVFANLAGCKLEHIFWGNQHIV